MVKTLELADKLERVAPKPLGDKAAAELRRLVKTNEALLDALKKIAGDVCDNEYTRTARAALAQQEQK